MVGGPTQSKEEKFGINVSGTFCVRAASVGLDRSGFGNSGTNLGTGSTNRIRGLRTRDRILEKERRRCFFLAEHTDTIDL